MAWLFARRNGAPPTIELQRTLPHILTPPLSASSGAAAAPYAVFECAEGRPHGVAMRRTVHARDDRRGHRLRASCAMLRDSVQSCAARAVARRVAIALRGARPLDDLFAAAVRTQPASRGSGYERRTGGRDCSAQNESFDERLECAGARRGRLHLWRVAADAEREASLACRVLQRGGARPLPGWGWSRSPSWTAIWPTSTRSWSRSSSSMASTAASTPTRGGFACTPHTRAPASCPFFSPRYVQRVCVKGDTQKSESVIRFLILFIRIQKPQP